jgi:hypothetical protein
MNEKITSGNKNTHKIRRRNVIVQEFRYVVR